MKRISDRRRKRLDQVRDFRRTYLARFSRCWICGCSLLKPRPGPREISQLCLHEILNGPLREKVLDEPCALLVLCWHCNGAEVTDKRKWPAAKQLALLRYRAPEAYDLARFNWLRNPDAPSFVEQAEVDAWAGRMFN